MFFCNNNCLYCGYDAVLSYRRIDTFRRKIVPLSLVLNCAGPGIVYGYWQVTRRVVTWTSRRRRYWSLVLSNGSNYFVNCPYNVKDSSLYKFHP
jgi:hypothetical protein